MKVEHLTITGSSLIRDTVDILPRTMAHFAHLEKHPKLSKIGQTPFDVKMTVQDGIAIFDIMKNGQILFVNVCCFDAKDKEPAMLYLKDMVRGNPFFKTAIIREPKEHLWLFTIPINVLAMTQDDAALAGEIEFYIYNAIRLGLKNNIQ